jgi:hypothetical protein
MKVDNQPAVSVSKPETTKWECGILLLEFLRGLLIFFITDSLKAEINNRAFDFGSKYFVLWRLLVENQLQQVAILFCNADYVGVLYISNVNTLETGCSEFESRKIN